MAKGMELMYAVFLSSQMESAAEVISLSGPPNEHRLHAERAIAGAKSDSLLAQNLASHFIGSQTETMSEMLVQNLFIVNNIESLPRKAANYFVP
jgi:hypothetical protein